MLGLGIQLNKGSVKSIYGPELIPGGRFNDNDLDLFDSVSTAFTINGSNQLVGVTTGSFSALFVDFDHTVGDFYRVSYDVISSDLDGTVIMSTSGGFGSKTLDISVGHHVYEWEFTNASPDNDWRMFLSDNNTAGKTIIMDNISVKKKL